MKDKKELELDEKVTSCNNIFYIAAFIVTFFGVIFIVAAIMSVFNPPKETIQGLYESEMNEENPYTEYWECTERIWEEGEECGDCCGDGPDEGFWFRICFGDTECGNVQIVEGQAMCVSNGTVVDYLGENYCVKETRVRERLY